MNIPVIEHIWKWQENDRKCVDGVKSHVSWSLQGTQGEETHTAQAAAEELINEA